MREILYRGKTKIYNKWVYGWYCGKILSEDMAGTEESSQIIDAKTLYWHTCEAETVGQFTGLTDKNGKKIFEGDLLNGFFYPYYRSEEDTHNYFAEVVWFDGNCAFGLVTHKHPTSMVRGISDGNAVFVEDFEQDDWEIIGNIHDNPELLEVE